MTTELPDHMDNPNDLAPLALVSSEGLGPAPERAEFEAWFRGRSAHYEYTRALPSLLKFGAQGLPEHESRYHDRATEEAWQSWQAAKAAERERWEPLVAELRHMATKYEMPDGDYCSVSMGMWAEDWLRKLRV